MLGNRRRAAFRAAATALLAAAGALALSWSGLLQGPDRFFYDAFHGVTGKRYEPRRTTIVSIDDETLREFGDEPLVFWGPHFAEAIRTLRRAGAGVVGIDFLFSVSAESWLRKIDAGLDGKSRTHDLPFREQIASGKVVLIGLIAGAAEGEGRLLLPISEYLYVLPGGTADIGLANLHTDPDGVTRRYMAAMFNDGTQPSLTFAALLAGKLRAKESPPEAGKNDAGDLEPRLISFAGPPGTFKRISFKRLLEPGAEKSPDLAFLNGRVVIIAAENLGSQDLHLTPYSGGFANGQTRMMSGAEVHANIIETILSGLGVNPAPAWLEVIFMIVAASAGAVLMIRSGPWRGLAGAGGLAFIWLILAYALFRHGTVVSSGGPLLSLGFCWLATVAQRMTRGERERASLTEMFGRYVSDEVLEKLLSTGRRPDLGGEEAQVTVLFSDIRNFTTISEKLSPTEVVEMLNSYFSRACEPILKEGGTVDKFIGDAVMAVFGAPVPYQDHARRAICAALAMREIAEEFRLRMKERFPGAGLPDFAIGIGIHTGAVIVGNVGSPRRMSYTAIGDAVNVASRLEGKTKEAGAVILASSDTVAFAGPGIGEGRRLSLQVKGRIQPVEACEILGLEG